VSEGAGDFIGLRVQSLREGLGLTQDELASEVGFASRQTLSDLERGRREVKASELSRLARALKTDVGALLAESEPAHTHVLWRARPQDHAETLQADFLNWCERYAHVKRVSGSCEDEGFAWPCPSLRIADAHYEDAEELARQVAAHLALGARPAASLQRALETQLGVMVWYLDLGVDGSAACSRGEFGDAILVNRREAPWRRNFDIAHELFHLLTWETTCSELTDDPHVADAAERLANAFAAALLLPADSLTGELNRCARSGKIMLDDLIAIARDFDVSTSALLWRLHSIGCGLDRDRIRRLLEDPGFRQRDRSSRVGAWWDPSPLPERFVWLAALATAKGRLSRTKLSEYLDCGLADLDVTLEQYGVSESGPGVVLPFSRTADDFDVHGGEDGSTAVCLT
jgi:Zn-dependent peptidase ImmA (M78 family)/transcriptional regulator with XRE-family HTH domain